MRRVLLLLCLSPTAAPAADVSFEFGPDVVHAVGLRAWYFAVEPPNSRFRYGQFGLKEHKVQVFSAEYVWRAGKRCRPSLGIAHLDHLTPLSGTFWNFSIGVQCMVSEDVFLAIIHFSHGSMFGIEPNKTNKGLNFVTVGTRTDLLSGRI